MNKKILGSILLIALVVFITLPFAAHAEDKLCTFVKSVRDLSLTVGGSIVAIGWVIAGIIFLTAAGGARMEVGKKALIAAVIGTALVIISVSAGQIMKDALKTEQGVQLCP